MTTLFYLTINEVEKTLRKRRFQVIFVLLIVLIAVFSYAMQQATHALTQELGTTDWHLHLQQEITDDVNQMHSPFLSSSEKAGLQATISEAEYELNHNLNPYSPGAPTFMRTFMDEGIFLLIPMFVVVLAADIVSSEMSGGTIKVILTRGVSRSRVLASKLVALCLLVSMMIAFIAVASYGISGLFFGYQGFGLPTLFGYHVTVTGYVNLSHVYTIPQWKYLVMTYGLGFFSCLSIACLSFLVSTLVRSTASGIGIMMASLIAGTLLCSLANNWTLAKFLPVVNLALSDYINGSPPPIAGMTFAFSVSDLAISSIVAITMSFLVFTRRDIMG